jgi:hypothetical protein
MLTPVSGSFSNNNQQSNIATGSFISLPYLPPSNVTTRIEKTLNVNLLY